jgi:hypothetical protein
MISGASVLIGLITSPKKDSAIACDGGTAAGTSMNREHPFFVEAGNQRRCPSNDLFGGTNSKLAALVATPGIPGVA